MASKKPVVTGKNAHFLKGHASWLYCDGCNKTVAYLCYVTYSYFRFSFACRCGCHGSVENRYGDIDLPGLPLGQLIRSAANNRFACEKDSAPLFSPVYKNLKAYRAELVCKQCSTRYTVSETVDSGAHT